MIRLRNNLDYIPSWLDGATTLLQKLNKCIARVEELAHSDITEVNARLDVIQPTVNELVEDVDSLENDVETLKEYIQPDVSELETEVENIKAEIGDENSGIIKDIGTLATEIDGVQGTLESVGEDVDKLENSVENINTELGNKASYVFKITNTESPTNHILIGRDTALIIVQISTGGTLTFKRKETQQSTFEITKTYTVLENETFYITQRGMEFTVFKASNGNYEHIAPEPFSYNDYERRLELTSNYGAIIKVGD